MVYRKHIWNYVRARPLLVWWYLWKRKNTNDQEAGSWNAEWIEVYIKLHHTLNHTCFISWFISQVVEYTPGAPFTNMV